MSYLVSINLNMLSGKIEVKVLVPVTVHPSTSDIISKTKPDANYKDRLPNGNYVEKTASHYVIVTGTAHAQR